MQQKAEQLREYMDKNDLSQAEMGRKAGVSQPTVCRMLQAHPKRWSAAQQRLFRYIGATEYQKWRQVGQLPERIAAAFENVWDHTELHAEAIAKVIEALADLGPRKR